MKKCLMIVGALITIMICSVSFAGEKKGTGIECRTMGIALDATNELGGDIFVVSENKSWFSALYCWQNYAVLHCKYFDKTYIADKNSNKIDIDIIYKTTISGGFEVSYLFSATISCNK